MQAEPRATGTDANAMQLARGGSATALISIPNRYMHTSVEVVSLKDLESAVSLIAETILSMSGKENFIPGWLIILFRVLFSTAYVEYNQPRDIYSSRRENHVVCSFLTIGDEAHMIKDAVQKSMGNP